MANAAPIRRKYRPPARGALAFGLRVSAALAAAALFSVTFVPAAVAIVVTGKVSEKENFFMRGATNTINSVINSVLPGFGNVQ